MTQIQWPNPTQSLGIGLFLELPWIVLAISQPNEIWLGWKIS